MNIINQFNFGQFLIFYFIEIKEFSIDFSLELFEQEGSFAYSLASFLSEISLFLWNMK